MAAPHRVRCHHGQQVLFGGGWSCRVAHHQRVKLLPG